MSLPEVDISGPDSAAGITTPRLANLSYQEVALDWIVQVLNLDTMVVDALVITDEGGDRLSQIVSGTKYNMWSQREPSEGPSATEREEEDKRLEQLESKLREAASTDPNVIAKNKFLAMLAEQMDGAETIRRLIGETVELRIAEEGEISVEEQAGIQFFSDVASTMAMFQSGHIMNLLVSMRRYAEAVGNNPVIYQQQFMGLWDIYNLGSRIAHSPADEQ